MKNQHVWLIRLCAFLCGAAVMALEMVGVRLLEPYLGSTIYVWGAIIGIFLGALALGYYLGGKFADQQPNFVALGILIILAAAWTFGVPVAAVIIGDWASRAFIDPRWQTFFAALILYAVPSVLLGMVSPFLVRLATKNLSNVGQTAGNIYALSTCGSIVGTFLVSFVLTEYVGSMNITFGIGGVLLLTALLCLATRRIAIVTALGALLLCALGWASAEIAAVKRHQQTAFNREPTTSMLRQQELAKHLAIRESPYHLINVFESNFDFDRLGFLPEPLRARYMVFNDQLESGCHVENGVPLTPVATACGYVKLLTLGVLITGVAPEKVAIIGCGGGVLALMLNADYPAIKRLDVAEIDEQVLQLAGEFFNYPYPDRAGSNIRSYAVDGRQFLRYAENHNYDYVVLDAYTAGGRIPRHLISREFFQLAAQKLTPDGAVVVNIISDINHGRLFKAVLKTASSVFKHVYVFPRNLLSTSNVILVGSNHDGAKMSSAELLRQWQRLASEKLLKQPIEFAVRNSPAALPDFATAPLLTDDFCPTDSMIAGNP